MPISNATRARGSIDLIRFSFFLCNFAKMLNELRFAYQSVYRFIDYMFHQVKCAIENQIFYLWFYIKFLWHMYIY